MGWLSEQLNSSIGKKFIMAVTGISLILFLVIHLLNNLLLFLGPEIFNENVARLEGIKPLVRVIELILVIIFGWHIINGVRLYFENKKASPGKYAVNAAAASSTFYSRFMNISGTVILIFLVIHLATFWREFNFHAPTLDGHPFYNIIAEAFANPFISLFYIVAMVLLGMHLNHAFQSSFQTLGWQNKKYGPAVKRIGSIIALVFALGFSAIPIFFFLSSLGGN